MGRPDETIGAIEVSAFNRTPEQTLMDNKLAKYMDDVSKAYDKKEQMWQWKFADLRSDISTLQKQVDALKPKSFCEKIEDLYPSKRNQFFKYLVFGVVLRDFRRCPIGWTPYVPFQPNWAKRSSWMKALRREFKWAKTDSAGYAFEFTTQIKDASCPLESKQP